MSAAATTPLPVQAAEERPWDRPFWKPVKGKGAIFFYLVLIHVFAIIGLILFPVPGWKVFAVTFVISADLLADV